MIRGRDGRAQRPPPLPLPFSLGIYCGCFVLASLVFSFLVLVLVACNAFAVVLVSFPLGLLSDMVRWLMGRMALAAGRSAGARTRYATIGCGAAAALTDFGGPAAAPPPSHHVRECARLAAIIAESGRYRQMPLSGSMPVVAIGGVLTAITNTVGPAGVVVAFLAAVVLVGVQGAARPALSLAAWATGTAGRWVALTAPSWPPWPWATRPRPRWGPPAWPWAPPSWLWEGAAPPRRGAARPDALGVVEGGDDDSRGSEADGVAPRAASATDARQVVAHRRPVTRSEARKMQGKPDVSSADSSFWQ